MYTLRFDCPLLPKMLQTSALYKFPQILQLFLHLLLQLSLPLPVDLTAYFVSLYDLSLHLHSADFFFQLLLFLL